MILNSLLDSVLYRKEKKNERIRRTRGVELPSGRNFSFTIDVQRKKKKEGSTLRVNRTVRENCPTLRRNYFLELGDLQFTSKTLCKKLQSPESTGAIATEAKCLLSALIIKLQVNASEKAKLNLSSTPF